jgi:rhodanese-related sulfurtransferase
MPTTCSDLIAQAVAAVPSLDAAAALAKLGSPDVAFVDVRDEPELVRFGRIPGAVHVSRGQLEFIVDPTGKFHNPVFFSGQLIVFYCMTGVRSVLAARTARELGVADVANLEGGIRAWIAAGGSVEPHQPP